MLMDGNGSAHRATNSYNNRSFDGSGFGAGGAGGNRVRDDDPNSSWVRHNLCLETMVPIVLSTWNGNSSRVSKDLISKKGVLRYSYAIYLTINCNDSIINKVSD